MKRLTVLLTSLALLTSCSKKADPVMPDPLPDLVVDFDVPAHAETTESLAFQNNSRNANGYEWDFGDGTAVVTDPQPHHTYTTFGTYVITLRARQNANGQSVTKKLKVAKYDSFAHAGIAATANYSTRGRRYDTTFDNGQGTSTTVTKPLRDSLFTIIRLSPDSLRVNGFLARPSTNSPFVRLSATNPYVFQMSVPGRDATYLGIYLPGDSIQLRQYSHNGHLTSRIDEYGGLRRP